MSTHALNGIEYVMGTSLADVESIPSISSCNLENRWFLVSKTWIYDLYVKETTNDVTSTSSTSSYLILNIQNGWIYDIVVRSTFGDIDILNITIINTILGFVVQEFNTIIEHSSESRRSGERSTHHVGRKDFSVDPLW